MPVAWIPKGSAVALTLLVISVGLTGTAAAQQVVTDFERPYVYIILPGTAAPDSAQVQFVNTNTGVVENSISIGVNPTDATINYGEGRLYVTNWQHNVTRVVDLTTQQQITPLTLGTDVYKINAGRAGRVYYEEEDQWVVGRVIDTATGQQVGQFPGLLREGDAEIDPSGTYYYHCDNNSSGARVTKYDISTDLPVELAEGPVHGFGSRNLVLSRDGSRLFWRGYIYDADLNEIGFLDDEIYATSLHGDLAVSETQVYNTRNGQSIYTFSTATSSVGFSGDQSQLIRVAAGTGQIEIIAVSDFAGMPGPALDPVPSDASTIVLPLPELSWAVNPLALSYQVYFGTDPVAVAAANTSSPEYLGEVVDNRIALDADATGLGETYYWRVDVRGLTETTTGSLWTFDVAPLVAAPEPIIVYGIPGGPPQTIAVTLSAGGAVVPWSLTEDTSWVTVSSVSGSTPETIEVTIDPAGLEVGTHSGALHFVSGDFAFDLPVELTLLTMSLSQMVTDYARPYIYALHPGSTVAEDAYLFFINTDTAQVEKAIPIGINPTDMTINYGEGRLYVTNWQHNFTRVVDLTTQQQIAPLELGTDVYKINAGRPGRIYYEGEDQWVTVSIIDTATGQQVGQVQGSVREGDGEVDPTGNYYYHNDNNISNAHITKYDISTDTPVELSESLEHPYGSRNLVLSGDGSRLFWRGYIYDADLNEIGNLTDEVYTTTLHGDLAISETQVYNTHTGDSLYTLPYVTQLTAVSGDQATLFLFNPGTGTIEAIPMSDIAEIPGPGLNPTPGDMGTIILPLDELSWDVNPLALGYRVYLGTDPAAVAAADMDSPEYLGEVTDNRIGLDNLALGQTYYWRVDIVGFTGTTIGSVWSFSVAPLIVAPNSLPVSTVVGAPPQTITLTLSAAVRGMVSWSVTEDIPWLSVNPADGTTPGTIDVTIDPAGLTAGLNDGVLAFSSGKSTFDVPVSLELFDLALTRMLTDFERPYIYGLHAGSGDFADAFLVFINTDTEQIEKAIPIGINPTDMTINYGEGRLYVSNWQNNLTRVVDLTTQEQLEPLDLGPDVFRINAGRPGRIYYEEEDQWIDVLIIDTATGQEVGELPGSVREGDGEIDPTGSYYYHCGNNSSGARITKYDITTDSPIELAESLVHGFGSRNLVLSADGSRLFWQGYIYDDDLNEIGNLADEVYTTTLHGDLAISETQVYNSHTGDSLYTLPYATELTAVSGDQSKLFLFNPLTAVVEVIPMTDIAEIPGPGLNPTPGDTGTIILPLNELSWDVNPLAIGYRVYLGTDAAAVAAADTDSPEYLGEVIDNRIGLDNLALGQTYYWRVDIVGFTGTTIGSVWSFSVAPLIVAPNSLPFSTVVGAPPQTITLTLSAAVRGMVSWSVTEDIPWLSVNPADGTTPGTVDVTIDPAGLTAGLYDGILTFSSGKSTFDVPVDLELFDLALTQMLTDFERPYVYGLHPGSGDFQDAFLVFINTDTEQIEKAIPIGIRPTDMTINYGEGRLYVTNWENNFTRVVDLTTQEQIAPLQMDLDVFRINAGRAGRIYAEYENYSGVSIIDTATGLEVDNFPIYVRYGDGEIDATGSYYYHSDSNTSNAHLTKFDISTDNVVTLGTSIVRSYGSRNLVLSGDGSRLFWQGYVYDDSLNEIGYLGDEIYSTTLGGELAIGETQVLNSQTGVSVYSLPFATQVTAVSSDQAKLFLFNPGTGAVDAIPMTDIAGISGVNLDPLPADTSTVVMPLDELSWVFDPGAFSYHVYFGTDPAAVASADINSPEYMGEVFGNTFAPDPDDLELGQTYYWRVDGVGFLGTTVGPVWSFSIFPLIIDPVSLRLGAVAGGPRQIIELTLSSGGTPMVWSVSEDVPWIELNRIGGTTPSVVQVALDPDGLQPGTHNGGVTFATGGMTYEVQFQFDVFTMVLSQMVTDFERPYIYGLHPGSGSFEDAFLVFINTDTEQVEKAISIGIRPTDMTINYGEGRLYVTNWLNNFTRVVDLTTQEQIAPLELGTDVYKINAGRPGRIYYEEEDQWIDVPIIDTATGLEVGELPGSIREGDGEIDPTGTYYYHSDNNISNAHITKYNIATDNPVSIATSLQHPSGPRHLLLSADGSRLFWRGYVYDDDLNEIGNLGDDILATTLHGDLAISETQVYNSQSGAAIYTLPYLTQVMAVSGDQARLFLFNPITNLVEAIPMTNIANIPGPGLNPTPGDMGTIVLPLDDLSWDVNPLAIGYRVYLGTDPAAVAAADMNSPEYLGEVTANHIGIDPLALGQTYYWRVDIVGFAGTTIGSVWSFSVAPLIVTPNNLRVSTVSGAPPNTVTLTLSANGNNVSWSATEEIDWLTFDTPTDVTPGELEITLDPAGLVAGVHTGAINFVADGFSFEVPVELEVFEMTLTQMLTDFERPYIYGLHAGTGDFADAFLIFINTDTEQIEKAIPIGISPTDMTINYGEGRLYVSNWQHSFTRVVDLTAQEQIDPLNLGNDVFKINAGRPGRIYIEGEDQWVTVSIIDTATGQQVGQVQGSVREGDGEVDPTGSYYYHSDNNISNAHITKYDITTDSPVALAESLVHGFGSRNLLMSGDGSRLFWRGYIYDNDLNEIGNLADEVYSTTLRGDLAIGETQVYSSQTGAAIYSLPYATTLTAVSGDQATLFLFNPGTGTIEAIPMTDIAEIPGPGLNPTPGDMGTIILPLDELSWDVNPLAIAYRVYLGTDPAAVAAADMNSPEYLGEVTDNRIGLDNLALGQTYYWRVDIVGFSGTTIGSVWSFSVAPLIIAPNSLPVSTVVGAPPQTITLTLSAAVRGMVSWSVTEDIPWLSVNPADGTTPGTIDVTIDPAGLIAGLYDGVLTFSSGKSTFDVPVSLELFNLALTRMLTDFERPYIYGLHAGSGDFADAFLVFINTDTEQIEKAIPIGINPTDMTINYGEGRLYVSNWQNNLTRVVDLTTQEQLEPLDLGPDVFRINAGRPGRIYYEEEDQWIDVLIIDTATGQEVGELPGSVREGDGEIDPTGSYYYHCGNNSSGARITKYDITTDSPIELAESLVHGFGSRNLVLSADGSRLFWQGYIYDDDLNEIGNLADEVYTTTLHGDLAISETQVYNSHTGDSLYTLPYATELTAVSGDQSKLFLFNPLTAVVEVIPMTDIAEIPGPGLNPTPGDTGTIILPLNELSWDVNPLAIAYRVYLGTDAAAVAAADMNSPEYLGEVTDNRIGLDNLALGQTYYWRVDIVGFTGTTIGSVWSFGVAPLTVTPSSLYVNTVIGAQPATLTLELSADGANVSWSATEQVDWLTLDTASGVTPGELEVTLDSAGLVAGVYDGAVTFAADGVTFEVPVEFEVFEMVLTQMVTDFERPYVYGLHAGSGDFEDAFLVLINTGTEQIEKVIPIGINPTDMTINYGEGRLYVTNWQHNFTRVVDLTTQEQVEPLNLGNDVFKINAGRPGRIYVEEEDQWIYMSIVDSTTGMVLGTLFVREGDAEIDPTGSYYYHSDNNSSGARITKYDITTDFPVELAESLVHGYGSRNLVLSADGSRLFWQGYIYDDDLNEIGNLSDEIYTTTLHGDLAISQTRVYNSHTGDSLYTLPFASPVSAVSGDQSKLFLFNPDTGAVEAIPMSDIAEIPGPGLNPTPADTGTIILPLDELSWDVNPLAIAYRVYLGTDEAAVAAADVNSPEYLGQVSGNHIGIDPLALGQTYYWRVDIVGFSGTTIGSVWSFGVAPLIVAPNNLHVSTVAGAPPNTLTLTLSANGANVSWSATEQVDWLTLDTESAVTPGEITVSLDPAGLSPGVHVSAINFVSGENTFDLPIEFEVFEMNLTKMLTDFERPYVYGLHAGSGNFEDAFLIFFNTDTIQIEKALPIGINPTDMTINYGEGRLYVTNWQNNFTRVVDLTTQEQLEPLELGPDVFKINAGRPGRIYYEEEDQWIDVPIINTATGQEVGELPGSVREGDGEIDPTGTYYYHSDNNISNAHITKYDISTDSPVELAESIERPYGSRNLVLSGDGSRLFWRGYVYDDDLNEIANLGEDIYSTTLGGDLAISATQVYNTHTGAVIYTLPFVTTVTAVTADQANLLLFNQGIHAIEAIPMTDIAEIPGPGLNPIPGDAGTIVLPLDRLSWDVSPLAISYRVYLGTSAAAVAAADMDSPEYLGEVADNHIGIDPLTLGQTYYWRVDIVGFSGTTIGSVWSFSVAPLIVTPNDLQFSTVVGAQANSVALMISANGASVSWSATEQIDWLTLDASSGVTPGELTVSLDPAGLLPGVHIGTVNFSSGGYSFEVPVELEVFEMVLTQMVTDFERPYVYGLHAGSGDFEDAFVVLINTDTDQVEKAIPIGINPTDMTINYGEDRLYVTNWQHNFTRVVDLITQEQIAPLNLGPDVYRINAGIAGRIYYEEEDQWIAAGIVDTSTGLVVNSLFLREGDGEMDPTGTFYYHCDNNISDAHITRFRVFGDSPVAEATSPEHPYGSRNLVLSRNGGRLFWRGYVYNANLDELINLEDEIYASSFDGSLAISETAVYDTLTGDAIYSLPFTTQVTTVSGDQAKLFMFNPVTGGVVVIPTADIVATSQDDTPRLPIVSGQMESLRMPREARQGHRPLH